MTLLAFFISAVAIGQEHAELREQILKEAPLAWSKYLQLACHVQGEMKSTQVDKKADKTLSEGTTAIKINGSLGLYTTEEAGKPIRLMCDNGEYSFIVDATSTTEWTLKQLVWAKKSYAVVNAFALSKPGEDTVGSSDWQKAIAVSGRGLYISATWLPAIFNSTSFKLVDARKIKDEGDELIHVDFEYSPRKIRNNPVRNGYVILDPSRFWLIKRSEVQASWDLENVKGVITTENKLDDTMPGFPYVAHQISRREVSADVDHEHEYTYLIKLKKMDASDIEPFQLPAYGIPEPASLRLTPSGPLRSSPEGSSSNEEQRSQPSS